MIFLLSSFLNPTLTTKTFIDMPESKKKFSKLEQHILWLFRNQGYIFAYWRKKIILPKKPLTELRYKLNYMYHYLERLPALQPHLPLKTSAEFNQAPALNPSLGIFKTQKHTPSVLRNSYTIHFNTHRGLRLFTRLKWFNKKRQPLYVSVLELKLLVKGSQIRYPTHTILLKTSKGLRTSTHAIQENVGGQLIALIA